MCGVQRHEVWYIMESTSLVEHSYNVEDNLTTVAVCFILEKVDHKYKFSCLKKYIPLSRDNINILMKRVIQLKGSWL